MKLHHILLGILVSAMWGVNFVAIHLGLKDFPPFVYAALRFIFAASPLLLLRWAPPAPFKWIVIIGMTLFGAQFSFLYLGMHLGAEPGLSSLILQIQAFFTIFMAAVFFGERPKRRQIIGCIVAFCGLGLIATSLENVGTSSAIGIILVICAAFGWASGNIAVKHAKPKDMRALIMWASLIASVPLLVLSLIIDGPERIFLSIANASAISWGAVAYIVVISTWIGYVAWTYLVHHYSAAEVSPFALLVPVFGMSSSAVLLNEAMGPLKIFAAFLIMAGLAICVIPLGHLRSFLRPKEQT